MNIMVTRHKKRLRHSYYLITINTNLIYYEDNERSEQLKEAMRQTVNSIFGPKLDEIVRLKRDKRRVDEPIDPNDVEDVKFKYGFEVGKEQHRLHIHGILLIDHRSTLWINSKRAQNMFIESMNSYEGVEMSNVYMNFELMKDAIRAKLQHHEKTPDEILMSYLNKSK